MIGEFLKTYGKRMFLPQLPGFVLRKKLLYVEPVDQLLRGCVFETSSFSKGTFNVTMFVQPLYVPIDTINLTFGRRIGGRGDKWWDLTAENPDRVAQEVLTAIQKEALPLFVTTQEPADVPSYLTEIGFELEDERAVEAMAYSYILSGEWKIAELKLAQLGEILAPDTDIAWIREKLSRTQALAVMLQSNPRQAVAQLNTWSNETLKHLKLPK